MSQHVLRRVDAQPAHEVPGLGVDGAPARVFVLVGQIDVSADVAEGPSRIATPVRFLVPGAPSVAVTTDPARLRASVSVHALGVSPIVASDTVALVEAARALFVADGRGGLTVGVEIVLETLSLTPSRVVRFGYQVFATVPA